jgi:hypothetical protein
MARMMPRWLLVAALVSCAATPCSAQFLSNLFDPSVISAGMGGASAAVPWSAEPNYWANPALLGYYQGIRWQWSRTRLAPDFLDHAYFASSRFVLAGAGVGMELTGRPFEGMGNLRLDYGPLLLDPTDPSSVFDLYERVDAVAVGVSLGQFANALLSLRDSALPPVTRHGDIALGYAEKHTLISGLPGLSANQTSHDFGFLVRAELSDQELPGPFARIEASYGRGEVNYEGSTDLGFFGILEPVNYMYRDGGALRFDFGHSGGAGSAGLRLFRVMTRGLGSPLSVGFALDREYVVSGISPYDVTHEGAEIAFFRILSVRAGHVKDDDADIHGNTFGAGLTLPIGEALSVRYDYAKYPEAMGLRHLDRHGVSIFFDPLVFRRRD